MSTRPQCRPQIIHVDGSGYLAIQQGEAVWVHSPADARIFHDWPAAATARALLAKAGIDRDRIQIIDCGRSFRQRGVSPARIDHLNWERSAPRAADGGDGPTGQSTPGSTDTGPQGANKPGAEEANDG